jgi:hypothetical protein
MVRFDDRGNAPEHYQQPLPVGSIDRLVELDARIAAVEQPASSVGARSVEAPEQLRTRVSERLRHKQRALSPWDYERLVLQHFTQIYKAKCLPAGVVEPGVIHVLVIPDIRNSHPSDVLSPTAPANLLAEIKRWLTEHTPAAANVRVRNPVYVPVTVRLAVRFTDASDIGAARKLLNADLIRFLSPWAYDEGADVAIGGSIHANSILEYVDRLGYVDYVSDLKLFTRPGRGAIDYVSTEQPDQVLVAAHTHHIDGSNPGRGIGYMKMDVDFVVKDPEL